MQMEQEQRVISGERWRRRHEGGRLRIAIAAAHGLPAVESALVGVREFARGRGGWSLTRMPEGVGSPMEWLRRWDGDGAFAAIGDREGLALARSLSFPVVNLSGDVEPGCVPTVCVDSEAIGRLGAEHLLGKRFRRFGFYGCSRYWYSRLRLKGFRETVERAGGSCAILNADGGTDGREEIDPQRELKTWLAGLQTAVGVMASTDVRANMVLEGCRELGLRVPEEVAVVGVDNDPVFAELEEPSLTSISRNGSAVGWRAAELMQRMFDSGVLSAPTVFVPPGAVIERDSTRTLAIDDPVVLEMVQYVRAHLGEKFGVERLVGRFALSRRALEYRFQAELKTSPYEFINRQRTEAAKVRLKEHPGEKAAAVASACGFADERRLRVVFQRVTGMTLGKYRASIGF